MWNPKIKIYNDVLDLHDLWLVLLGLPRSLIEAVQDEVYWYARLQWYDLDFGTYWESQNEKGIPWKIMKHLERNRKR